VSQGDLLIFLLTIHIWQNTAHLKCFWIR